MSELAQVEIEVPQYTIMTDKEAGFIALVVTTSGSMAQYFICDADHYKKAAGQFREMIMRGGAELKAASTGLITQKEWPNGLRKA
jgi:hypothetical protein